MCRTTAAQPTVFGVSISVIEKLGTIARDFLGKKGGKGF